MWSVALIGKKICAADGASPPPPSVLEVASGDLLHTETAALIGGDRLADGALSLALLPEPVSEDRPRGDLPMRGVPRGSVATARLMVLPPCPPALKYIRGMPPRRFTYTEERHADQRHCVVDGALLPSSCPEVLAFEAIPVEAGSG
ncbi:hypothetical protein NDU88_008087 [Pleurodeles waltl]|uniref:Uncharacterized protein n=1 Tax=Pleurodeles waltl TaxID=8319 RepID=A0AAV7VVC8_PLEWA|nr:hypothetical protein NDU88_008087 [Pleurodeles waltl]